MASMHVITPGMLTTIQDRGRWGWQNFGVPVAGPMDPPAHRLANALVGNDASASTLEATLVGPELSFDDERFVAVTGADFEVTVDGSARGLNVPFLVPAGSKLRFGARRSGARSYLAVEGGIDVPLVFDSRATHVPSRVGGLDGRSLRAGDRLPLGTRRARRLSFGKLATATLLQQRNNRPTVRVLPGPQIGRFTADALDMLQSAPYVIAPRSNRMGFRLLGLQLTDQAGTEMLSEATTIGAVQVPASGQPILLMADRQTTGGYPTVATVISADIGTAGQLAPGDEISFVVTTLRQAMAALISQEQALMTLESRRDG
jgi:antagonist of KipI